jgi:small subunit ribosomal protein S1
LAHISVLKRAGVDKTTKVGDVIEVAIRSVDTERNRISLTLPSLAAESKTSLRDLNAGSVVTGKIVRLVEFGAFVDIGAQTDGLIHISQLPWGYVNHPSEVLKVGDEVQVRILDVDASRRRISLTMKGLGDDEDSSDNNAYVAAANDRDNDGEPTPTAFEIAFQEAQRKRRQRRSR